jgi:SH3-like domain-containing protein
MVMVKYNVDFLRKEGVVVDRGLVAAREGPTEESNRKFDVAEGQLVQIRETRGPWFRVEDDKGREGWLQKSQLGIL